MNIDHLCPATIYVASPTGSTDHYNKQGYESPRAIKARVDVTQRYVRSPQGSMVLATHTLYTVEAIGIFDRVWLPGVDQTNAALSKPVVNVDSVPELSSSSTNHYEVALGV